MVHIYTYIPHRYWGYIGYMPNLVGIFVSGTYLAKTHKVEVAVGCILAYVCKNVWSICLVSMSALSAILKMWQPYLFNDTCPICVQCSCLNG